MRPAGTSTVHLGSIIRGIFGRSCTGGRCDAIDAVRPDHEAKINQVPAEGRDILMGAAQDGVDLLLRVLTAGLEPPQKVSQNDQQLLAPSRDLFEARSGEEVAQDLFFLVELRFFGRAVLLAGRTPGDAGQQRFGCCPNPVKTVSSRVNVGLVVVRSTFTTPAATKAPRCPPRSPVSTPSRSVSCSSVAGPSVIRPSSRTARGWAITFITRARLAA